MKLNYCTAGSVTEKKHVCSWPQDALLIFNLRTILETGSFFFCVEFLWKGNKNVRALCVYYTHIKKDQVK